MISDTSTIFLIRDGLRLESETVCAMISVFVFVLLSKQNSLFKI